MYARTINYIILFFKKVAFSSYKCLSNIIGIGIEKGFFGSLNCQERVGGSDVTISFVCKGTQIMNKDLL